jgi:hypothetical protein
VQRRTLLWPFGKKQWNMNAYCQESVTQSLVLLFAAIGVRKRETHRDFQRVPDGLIRSSGILNRTIEEKEIFLASKAACAGIVFILPTMRISGPRPAPCTARFGSKPQQRSASDRAPERSQDDAANSSGAKDTIAGRLMRLRSPNPSEHSRNSER